MTRSSDFPPGHAHGKLTLTIDLDRGLYSVNDTLHFPLSAVPENWIELVELAATGGSCHPSLKYHEAAHISPPCRDETLVHLYKSFEVESIPAPHRVIPIKLAS